jgi:nanoRNase/pAp phosphatase (c-di-AMP/oligoRNAs hydrolase)
MTERAIVKVYNKNNKLKFLFIDTDVTKTVSIYKYSGENIDTHSFTYAKKGELKFWKAYYEMTVEIDGVLKESLTISKDMMEHFIFNENQEIFNTSTNLNSGNIYEKRKKYYKGELYEAEFLNDELIDLKFNIQQNKVNEYLKKLKDGKEKN